MAENTQAFNTIAVMETQFFSQLPRRWIVLLWILPVLLLLMLPAALQAQFSYTATNGTITITEYTGPGGDVTIPATIAGLPVTSVGNYAFNDNINLTRVTIPGNVTNIGNGAFQYCNYLTNATICNGVTSIGDNAFNWCVRLASVTIPGSVAKIGDSPFAGCFALTAIPVDAQNAFYSSVNGVLFDKTQSTLIQYPPGDRGGNYTVPGNVTNIANSAFLYCSDLTNITIPNSVTSIGRWAFYSAGLTSIVIPGSVSSFGDSAFVYCSRLANVRIAYGVTIIPESAFGGCPNLTNITIPNSVTTIERGAFRSSFMNPASITIPGSVNSIRDYAFESCYRLTNIYCEGNAPNYGKDVFYGANNTTVYYLPGTTGWASTFGGRPTAPWVLPYPVILTTKGLERTGARVGLPALRVT